MLKRLWTKSGDLEREPGHSSQHHTFPRTVQTGEKWRYYLFDHAVLRIFWTNFWRVSKGVYRSNQPTHRRFEKYATMGIKTVINLRGEDPKPHYRFEKESCDALGLTLVNTRLMAREPAPRSRIQAVLEALKTAEKPLMFHCKSGADRSGFVAAAYLLAFEGATVEEAEKQLSLKYIHLAFTKTGVQDYILRIYKARLSLGAIDFETWINTEYSANHIKESLTLKRSELEAAQALIAYAQTQKAY